MPTHNTLLNNFKLMQEIMKTDSSMIEISFLPHFHAMGLICSYLQVLYHGGTGYFMSPVTFVENPGLWMKAFSLFHGTHAKAPNFAFELVMKKGFPKNADLGTARYIVTGSEPVSIETIEEFETTLAPHGLKRNTVRVGYGLAEHSVYLCGVRDHNDPTIIDGRISCGVPLPGETGNWGISLVISTPCVSLNDCRIYAFEVSRYRSLISTVSNITRIFVVETVYLSHTTCSNTNRVLELLQVWL